MTREEFITKEALKRYDYTTGIGNRDIECFKEGADWADKHSYNPYYTMSNCPNCKYVLFYNPYHNNYFVGKLDGDDNLVIDNEIQGKVSEFNYLYWTNLSEFDKDSVVDYSK